MEAAPGIEPGIKALQASALPLGYAASQKASILAPEVLSTLELAANQGAGTRPRIGLAEAAFLYCGPILGSVLTQGIP